jgi:hypothetical protein
VKDGKQSKKIERSSDIGAENEILWLRIVRDAVLFAHPLPGAQLSVRAETRR